MLFKDEKAQNIMEFVILLAVILSALLIMHIYVKRAYQGRIKQEADSVGPQYAPGHTNALFTSTTNMTSSTYIGGVTASGQTVPDGATATQGSSTTITSKREAVDALATE